MSVKLSTRQVGDVSVVDVVGRITLGEGSSAMRDALRHGEVERRTVDAGLAARHDPLDHLCRSA